MRDLSDDRLLRGLFEILKQTRHCEADLIAHIAEVDARRLWAREAAHSMFAYCTEVLHLSDRETGLRIRVARASRKHPVLLTMLRDGRIHLTGIRLLAPVLTRGNRKALLKRATHKSRREIEEIVAEVAPRPDVKTMMRKLSTRRGAQPPAPSQQVAVPLGSVTPNGATTSAPLQRPGAVASASDCHVETSGDQPVRDATGLASECQVPPTLPARPATVQPLSPARYCVRFTASAELHDKLEKLQALMRRSLPDADLATIIDVAVTEKLERLEAKRFGKTKRPRARVGQADTTPKSRGISAAVRRFVYKRDDGQCTYHDKSGRRCTKRHDLEFHHKKPFGKGGEHSPENLTLMCKAHNALLAEQDFGKEKMARHRRGARRASGAPTARTGCCRATPLCVAAAIQEASSPYLVKQSIDSTRSSEHVSASRSATTPERWHASWAAPSARWSRDGGCSVSPLAHGPKKVTTSVWGHVLPTTGQFTPEPRSTGQSVTPRSSSNRTVISPTTPRAWA